MADAGFDLSVWARLAPQRNIEIVDGWGTKHPTSTTLTMRRQLALFARLRDLAEAGLQVDLTTSDGILAALLGALSAPAIATVVVDCFVIAYPAVVDAVRAAHPEGFSASVSAGDVVLDAFELEEVASALVPFCVRPLARAAATLQAMTPPPSPSTTTP